MKFDGRYSRNHQALREEDQKKLTAATVAVVGCGGLGGYIAEECARLGVGHLVLIDADRFEISNLNRQILSTEDNLGACKAEAARERVQSINSEVTVTVFREYFTETNGQELLRGADLVCDALDSLTDRVTLEKTCHQMKRPLVYASIGGWFGMVGVSFPGDYIVAQLYGRGGRGIESKLGTPAFTPAVLASLSVAEAVKILTGQPPSLQRACLFVNLQTMEFDRLEMPLKENTHQ